MRRFTLTTAISALLVSGMMLTSGDAVAQRRGGDRGDRRSTAVSERSSQRAATTISRGDDNRRERSTATRSGGDRVSRDNKRSEVSNWPKVNRGSSGINDAGSRERRNSQSRGDAMRRSFDERRSAGNSGGDNMGNRPDNNNRPGGNISNRPGGGNGGNRPGGGNVGNRPDNNRPGGNVGGGRPGDNRPGGGNMGAGRSGGARPGYHIGGGDMRPGGHGHGHKPAPDHHGVIHHRPSSWHTPVAPPHRSFRPVHYHICRPVPPPGFRPWHRAPIISGILGLTFGTAYYSSLDYLFTRGYEIDGYYNGVVYLRNIQELNCFWPDVMLNYGSSNALNSAEFHYSTSYDDLGRFNRLYSDLCARYGQPVTYAEDSEGIRSTWYGGNARGFVSLEYYYNRGRYYTTLSYGN